MLDPGWMNKTMTLRLSPALIACAASSRSSMQTTSQKGHTQMELFRQTAVRWQGAELRTSAGSQSTAVVLRSSRSAQLAIEYRSDPVERTDNKAMPICAPHSAPVLLVARSMQRVAFVHLEPHGNPAELVMERRERKNVACVRQVSLEQHKHFVCTTVGATPLSLVPVVLDSRPIQRVFLLMAPESSTIKKKSTGRRLEPSRSQLLVTPKGPLVAKSLTAHYLDVLYGNAIEDRRAVVVKPTTGVVYPLIVWRSLEHRVVASRVVVLPLTTAVNLKETLHPLRPLAVRLSTVEVVTSTLVQHVLIDDDDVGEEQDDEYDERETRLMRSVSTVTCFSSRCTGATADLLYECESISESILVSRSSEHNTGIDEEETRQEDPNGALNQILYFMRQFVKDIDQISSRRPLTYTWARPTPSSVASAAMSANESLGRPRKVHLTDASLRTNR